MTWRPNQPNGWRPQVSVTPDRRIFITYGNAQCWLAELWIINGVLTLIRETLIDGARAWGGIWISPYEFIYWREVPDVKDAWEQRLVTISLDPTPWPPANAPRNVPISLAGGNANYAGPGDHWMAIRTGPGAKVVIDGETVQTGNGGAAAFAWPWFAFAANNDHTALKIGKRSTGFERTTGTRTALHASAISPEGKLLYGGSGEVWTLDPVSDVQRRATVTPWRYEGPQQVFRYGGFDWLVTVTHDPGQDGAGWVLLRPEGNAHQAILHPAPATDAHVGILDDQFIVAAANRGDMRVDLVPINTVPQALPYRVTNPARKCWAGCYYDAGRDGDLAPLGNCTVLSLDNFSVSGIVPPDAPFRMREAARRAGAIFTGTSEADIEAMRPEWHLVAGLVMGEHSTFTEMEQEAGRARQRMKDRLLPRRPIVATLMPNQPWARDWRAPKGVDILAAEFYLDAPTGSWPTQQRTAARRFDEVVAQLQQARLPIIMIAQAYDRAGAWPDAETREALMPVYADTLANNPIDGIWFFAHGRRGGIRDHSELLPWVKAIVASCPRPAIVTLPDQGGGGNTGGNGGSMAKPAITITEPNFPAEGIRIAQGGTLRCVWAREQGSGRIDKIQWLLDGRVAGDNHPDDPDHTFRGLTPGQHEIGARAIGPGGEHQTGKRRLVIVEGAATNPDPNPNPQPGQPNMKNITTLKALITGRVVCVDRDRPAPRSPHAIPNGVQVLANRTDAGPWEEIEVVYLPDGQVGFRGRVNDDTTALFCGDTTIEPRSPVLANREDREVEAIGGYEAFTPEATVADDGSACWAIKGHNGKYWRVDPADPQGRIFLDGDGAGPYERFSSTVPLIPRQPGVGGGGPSSDAIGWLPPAGLVRQEGWALADDHGPRPMLSVTLMDAETQFDQDRPRLAANIDYCRNNGVDFVRTLSEVDWPGKEANPRKIEQSVETVRFIWEREMRTELTIFGSHSHIDQRERVNWARMLARALRDAGLQAALALIEAFNEAGGARVTADECLEILMAVHEFLPGVPKATTAPYDRDASTTTGFGERSEEYKNFMRSPATIATPHLDRGVNHQEGEYRICRQGWNAMMMGFPWGSNEPAGPWASAQGANVMLDPNMQRVHCNGTWLQRGAFHCWHVDQGVGMRTDAPLWEAPGLPGLSAVRAFIPPDIANFQAKNWHWGDNPFESLRGVRDGNPQAPVRIHGLVDGGRVAGHVLGCDFGAPIRARKSMRLVRGSWDGTQYAPVEEFDIQAGREFFAPAAPDQIYVGRFI